ncbi:MAG TPA: PAS domain S-box protein, partial [Caldilineaceae bacterium]|nr:PAS domain S-box protein [Caldilineaceae bacterium]
PVYDEAGAVIKWYGATTDIQAQKEAEEAIRRRAQEFLALVEHAPDPVGRFDRAFRHVYVNPAVTRLTGLPADLIIGKTNSELGMSDAEAERWNACLAHVFATGEEVTQEFQLEMLKGLCVFETRFVPEFGADGQVETVLSLSRDVTARVQAEQALREGEERFRLIAEAIPVPFAILRYRDGAILFANRQFGLTHGASVEEILGESVKPLFDSPDELPQLLEELERDGAIHNREIRARRWCDGSPFWAAVSIKQLPFESEEALFIAYQDITERKEAHEAVRRSEALLQKVLETIPVGVWLLDATGRVIMDNPAGARIWGGARYEGLEQLGEYEAWHVDTGQPLAVDEWAGARAILYGESSQDEELEIECFDGAHKFIRQWAVPLYDDAGALLGAVSVNYDITEQRKAQEQIQYQATLLNNVSDAIVATDLELHITAWNPAAEALYGWRADEVMGQISTQVVQTSLTPVELEQIVQQLRSEGVWRGEITHHDRDGNPLLVLASISLVRDATGQPVGVVAVNRDITASKQAEAQLRILWRAVEQSATAMIVTDVNGCIQYVNPRFTELTGYTPDEVLGQNPRLLKSGYTPRDEYVRLWQTITAGGEWRGEFRNKKKNGEPYWESATIAPIFDKDGEITHFIAVKDDITVRKQREQEREALLSVATALRAAKNHDEIVAIVLQQASTIFEAADAYFVAAEPETGMLVLEAGYASGQLVDRPLIRFSPEHGISGEVYRTGRSYVSDNVLSDPKFSGQAFITEEKAAACIPLLAQQETIIGVLWVARPKPFLDQDLRLLRAIGDMAANALQRADLYEQVVQHAAHLEEQVAARTRELAAANERLLELDRLKSKFVSNVTHELRTPVTNLSLYLNLLGRRPEKQEQYMRVLHEQAERLRTLVNDVLELSRLDQQRETLHLAPVDLNELVQSVAAAHEARAEMQNLALVFEPAPDLPLIHGDRDKLIQVMTNLVANALNYTQAGRVVIRTCWDPDRRAVLAEVQDTGCGIHAEDLPHLFDRFYRGKRDQLPPVPGTGLGLSIVKELVELHGGTITVASEVGAGSTFTVYLPIP